MIRHNQIGLALLLIFLFVRLEAAPIQLTDDNFATYLSGNKATFVMFFGSKCTECQDLSPAWNRLADDWEGHQYGQIAQVDCETEGTDALCDYYQITDLPTLVVGGSKVWDVYYGSHDYDSLSDFAKRSISKPICSAQVLENCKGDDLAVLKSLLAKSTEELMAIEEKAQDLMIELQEEYERNETELFKRQQVLFDELNDVMYDAAGEFDYKILFQVWESRKANLLHK